MILRSEQPEWMAEALCAQTDPELFFPEKGGSTREAKKTCRRCPVTEPCLTYALEHDERFGIWGGLSERERWRVRKGQQLRAHDTNDWHGTPGGVRRHWVRGEPSCDPCRQANKKYRLELEARKAV